MTGETKHTPGPWQIGAPGPNGCYTVGTVQGLMTAVIAESLHDNPEVALADASLVSASPELLEALELYLGADNAGILAEAGILEQAHARAEQIRAVAIKAIAKAKGETV